MKLVLVLAIAFIVNSFSLLRAQSASEPAAAPDDVAGQKLYINNCSSCHQPAGQGMANMAPALKDNPILAGDAKQLIQILLKGPAAVLPANRPHYGSSTMDSFYYKLNDDEVAAILTYIRRDFGKSDRVSPVKAKDVATIRASIDPQSL